MASYDHGSDVDRKINAEYQFYISTTHDEIAVAARSAFKIGRHESLVDTHILRLHIRYTGKNDSSPPELKDLVEIRKKFKTLKIDFGPRTSAEQRHWNDQNLPTMAPGSSSFTVSYQLHHQGMMYESYYVALGHGIAAGEYDILRHSSHRQLNPEWNQDLMEKLTVYETGEIKGVVNFVGMIDSDYTDIVRRLALALMEAKKIETREAYEEMETKFFGYSMKHLNTGGLAAMLNSAERREGCPVS